MDALLAITTDYKAGSQGSEIVLEALKDKNRRIREVAINKIEAWTNSDRKEEVKKMLMSIGRKDKYAEVREAAISALDNHYKTRILSPILKTRSQIVPSRSCHHLFRRWQKEIKMEHYSSVPN
jgi:hypothetical protein